MPSLRLQQPAAVLRYLDFPGDAQPIVFVHGLGCAGSSHFPEVAARLAGHRRVIVDLFGHGYSDHPPDFGYSLEDHTQSVAQLMDHLSLKRCALFGHSMGGSIAITLATARPDLVSQLVLAEANLDPGGGFISKFIAGQTADEFAASGHDQLLDRLAARDFVTSVGSFQVSDSAGLHRSAVGLTRGTTPTMRQNLYALHIPRTFLVGEKSLPDPVTEELPRHGITVVVIPRARHDMMFDNPDDVAGAIKQALR